MVVYQQVSIHGPSLMKISVEETHGDQIGIQKLVTAFMVDSSLYCWKINFEFCLSSLFCLKET